MSLKDKIDEAVGEDYGEHTPAGEGKTGWHALASDLISLADVLGIQYSDSTYEVVLEEARGLDENNVQFQDYDDEWGKMGELTISDEHGENEVDVDGHMLELVSGTGGWEVPQDNNRPLLKEVHSVMVEHFLKKHGFPPQKEWTPQGQRSR